MSIICKPLTDVPFEEIYLCFTRAFSDYQLDLTYMNLDRFQNRAIKNAFRAEASVGIFVNNNLKGIALTGIEEKKNNTFAFDLITGIEKDLRGKGVSKQMLESIFPVLKQKGVSVYSLEVLQENIKAIKAYKSAGFSIKRNFDCYKLSLDSFQKPSKLITNLLIKPIERNDILLAMNCMDWRPSWENSLQAILRIPDRVYLYGAYNDGSLIGFIVYYPGLNWILHLSVCKQHRNRGVAGELISYIINGGIIRSEQVFIMNIDSGDQAFKNLLEKSGFVIHTRQHEMHIKLI